MCPCDVLSAMHVGGDLRMTGMTWSLEVLHASYSSRDIVLFTANGHPAVFLADVSIIAVAHIAQIVNAASMK